MLNKVIFIGRVVKTPEMETSKNGVKFTRFTIVNNLYSFKKETQEYSSKATFIDCIMWRTMAERHTKNLTKGKLISIAGRLEGSTWTDEENRKHSKNTVVVESIDPFLSRKNGENSDSDENQAENVTEETQEFEPSQESMETLDAIW